MTLLPVTLSNAGPLSSDILSLEVTEYPSGARVITVLGEIDGLTAPELNAFLTEQLIAGRVVVVNLDGVRFMGSAGLAVLFEAHQLALREGLDLRLVCNSQTVDWALDATGLREHFTIADTVQDALSNSC
ncbi:MAG TPA: anti-sigma factor antagonist [Pseudonocardiaceae bacterium]|nr:anti-sigma factor antagonist [Pseudonocardiaceae bacterium]